ncbi:MAG: RNA polymerase sigma factor [Acidobacteria bacterium]|nr:RNA polymerase sigma factor [Acidobacteriota bacterium]
MQESKREPNLTTSELSPRATDKALDDALVRRACAGDDVAFAELFERHKKRLAQVAGHYFNRREKIEDVVQEAFTKIFLALPAYAPQPGASFVAWISRIAINCCYDELRRVVRRPEDTLSNINPEEAEWLNAQGFVDQSRSDVEASVISRDLANKLLARLKPEDRLILTLMEVYELTMVEIADLTQWSVAKVKVRAHRARRALRRVLGEFI